MFRVLFTRLAVANWSIGQSIGSALTSLTASRRRRRQTSRRLPQRRPKHHLLAPTMPVKAKRVAVIGAGPAGAIAVDALAQEKAFDLIRVFERREGPGGCW